MSLQVRVRKKWVVNMFHKCKFRHSTDFQEDAVFGLTVRIKRPVAYFIGSGNSDDQVTSPNLFDACNEPRHPFGQSEPDTKKDYVDG